MPPLKLQSNKKAAAFGANQLSQAKMPPLKLSQGIKQPRRLSFSKESRKTTKEALGSLLNNKQSEGGDEEPIYVADPKGLLNTKPKFVSFTPNFNLPNNLMLLPHDFNLVGENKSPKLKTRKLNSQIKLNDGQDVVSLKLPSLYNYNQDHVNHSQELMEQFEQFFGADIATKSSNQSQKQTGGFNQSGSQVYKYNEEEEYFENLEMSGNFQIA